MKSMLLWFLLLMTTAPVFAETSSYAGKVVIIPVGEDDLSSRSRFEFMSRTLERCSREEAEGVIFDLDTPGGLLWDTVELMMTDLQKLKPRSFAYVNPRALSAGAMIAVATDGIYMSPTSSVGAASPVYGGGQEMGDAERAKMNSATMGMARAVAKKKGHNPAVIEAMSLSFKLTAREAEVLYWVVKGKTNKDIGDILGSSPMTVKKHLERVFVKLGVETRTAAAGMAMSRIRQLHPQFEG
jgi:membrane-bound ClpP family serine protease